MRVFQPRSNCRFALLAIVAAIPAAAVVGPPSISQAFGAGTIPVGGITSLTFTVTNPFSGITFTGVGFSDTLPAGLTVASPNGLTGSCGGGTITAGAGSGSITLAGGTIPAVSSCVFSINVTGTVVGVQSNSTSGVSSDQAATGTASTASITVSPALPSTVPTLSEWGMILLGCGLMAVAFRFFPRDGPFSSR